MDRRAVFFLFAAILSGALIAAVPEDPKHHYVTTVGPVLAIACLVMALLSFLDHLDSRHRD